jgi:hypothetical protein
MQCFFLKENYVLDTFCYSVNLIATVIQKGVIRNCTRKISPGTKFVSHWQTVYASTFTICTV